MAFGIHIDVPALAGVGFGQHPVQTGGNDDCLQQIGICRTVGQTQFKPAGPGYAHHMGAVIAGPCDGVGRPCGPRYGARCVDTLIAVDRRVGDCCQRTGVFHYAAKEMRALFRQAQFASLPGSFFGRKNIGFCRYAGRIPDRDMGMAAITG